MLSIRLPKDIESRLDKLAKVTGRTKTFYAREAILEHLSHLEDLYVVQQRLNSPGEQYSMDDVEKELGLDD